MKTLVRKIYLYTCQKCKKQRQTLREDRLRGGVCRKCLQRSIPKGQMSLISL